MFSALAFCDYNWFLLYVVQVELYYREDLYESSLVLQVINPYRLSRYYLQLFAFLEVIYCKCTLL